jgi:hypothetical protein
MTSKLFRAIRLAFEIPPRAISAKKLEKRRKKNAENTVKIILMNHHY